ncbi:solute:sodium symporter family transporter [Mesobacillus subterraneus]|uniref:Solute:sodium symporter family transporter n=1 Tax=Mesobacillus subterraneus TaxID=285983 RepID=A0A3R9E5P7_9BACI|nr:solute:sodium symporter family transporter [Mesobacillus subterraneus]RSD26715.1 solute:sodium symporter family transporter [Mesobacillus subterraneus]
MIFGGIGFTLLSAAFFMGLVAWYSYVKTKGEVSDTAGYFLAGRGLTGGFIAGSLLLTNLSAEQLVGLNGQAYRTNLSNMAWEVTAAFAIIIMAIYLLPKYLGGNFTTLPEFLSKRYDEGVRQYTVLLFMLGYILVTAPSMLYSGALAVLQLFNFPELFGISYEASVWIVIWLIGIIGAIYAIFGGLKAVAISDTLNGIGLIIIGLLVPILGLIALGDGSIGDGMKQIATTDTEKMNSIGTKQDSVPFGTIFTGMIFANLFYWASNQYVIQRTLGAKNLAEGQKGVLISGFYKLLVPLTMMIPGVIAFHMYGDGLKSVDLAYPALISDVLPTWMSGFFLAVLLGAVLSSFNSLLNSAATMFALDIYKARFNPKADDQKLISISKIAGTLLAVASLCIAPLLMNAPEGLWDLIRRFTGFFNIPIIVILLVGIFTKRVPALAAKFVIIFHVITYYMLVWGTQHLFDYAVPIHFIHIYAILFVVEVAIMIVIGFWKPTAKPYTFHSDAAVDMVPWKYSLPVSIVLLALVAVIYVTFSPIGLAYAGGYVSSAFWPIIAGILLVTVGLSYLAVKKWNKAYAGYLQKENAVKADKGRTTPRTKLKPTTTEY